MQGLLGYLITVNSHMLLSSHALGLHVPVHATLLASCITCPLRLMIPAPYGRRYTLCTHHQASMLYAANAHHTTFLFCPHA